MNELLSLFAIVAALTICGLIAEAPKSKVELRDLLDRWWEVLIDEAETFYEGRLMGLTSFAGWHSHMGYSAPRDWLSWQLYKHRHGRHLLKLRAFNLLERLCHPLIRSLCDAPWCSLCTPRLVQPASMYVHEECVADMTEDDFDTLRSWYRQDPGH